MSTRDTEKQTEMNTNAIGLIQKDIMYMSKGIDELKIGLKEIQKSMVDGFATKTSVGELEERVQKMEDMKEWAIKIIIGAIIVSLLAIIGIGVGVR